MKKKSGVLNEILQQLVIYKEHVGHYPYSIRVSDSIYNQLAANGFTSKCRLNVKIAGEVVHPLIIIDREFSGFVIGGM